MMAMVAGSWRRLTTRAWLPPTIPGTPGVFCLKAMELRTNWRAPGHASGNRRKEGPTCRAIGRRMKRNVDEEER